MIPTDMRTTVILGLGASLWAACGGGEPSAEPPPAGEPTAGQEQGAAGAGGEAAAGTEGKPSAIETLGLTGPETSWEQMSKDEKEFYMIGKVLPIMKEIFQRHEGETFSGEVGCETCHGEDMREQQFVMPTPSLPAVPSVGTSEYSQMRRDDEAIVAFMEQEVSPAMAKLLGKDAYGCDGCHPQPE